MGPGAVGSINGELPFTQPPWFKFWAPWAGSAVWSWTHSVLSPVPRPWETARRRKQQGPREGYVFFRGKLQVGSSIWRFCCRCCLQGVYEQSGTAVSTLRIWLEAAPFHHMGVCFKLPQRLRKQIWWYQIPITFLSSWIDDAISFWSDDGCYLSTGWQSIWAIRFSRGFTAPWYSTRGLWSVAPVGNPFPDTPQRLSDAYADLHHGGQVGECDMDLNAAMSWIAQPLYKKNKVTSDGGEARWISGVAQERLVLAWCTKQINRSTHLERGLFLSQEMLIVLEE